MVTTAKAEPIYISHGTGFVEVPGLWPSCVYCDFDFCDEAPHWHKSMLGSIRLKEGDEITLDGVLHRVIRK